MKKILSVITVSLLSITGFSQVASRLLQTQMQPQPISSPNFLWVDTAAGAQARIWVAAPDSLKINPFQMKWLKDSVITFTSPLYKPLNWFPTWTEVTGKPAFSTVATTGQYNDLLGKPTLFSGNYNDLTNKPTLFSGSYLDLTNKPSVFPTDIANVSGLTATLNNKITVGAPIPYSTITGTPTLATVATTGSYTDLINKPTIPAAQVNTDWNSSSGVSQLLNKPLLGTAAFTNSADYATAAQGSLATTAVQPGTLTSTLSGYATTTALTSGLAGKENTITAGTTSQYWRGDKTWQTLNTTVVPEGTNLYYTDARFDSRFATKTTTNLTEGSNLYYTDTRARLSNSAGTGISYDNTTGVITNSSPDQTVVLNTGSGISVTGTYPNFTIASTIATPTINSAVARTVNSNYTISSTRMATVNYSINITVTNPLLVGTSTGTAFLEYSTNGGTTWTTVSQISNSSGVGITVTLALTTGGSMILSGTIPANALTRIRTTTSGTASVTYVTGQEILQ